jgi:hypothetical protein
VIAQRGQVGPPLLLLEDAGQPARGHRGPRIELERAPIAARAGIQVGQIVLVHLAHPLQQRHRRGPAGLELQLALVHLHQLGGATLVGVEPRQRGQRGAMVRIDGQRSHEASDGLHAPAEP